MFRKTMTILSLIGLLLSVGLWGASFVGMGFYEKFSSPLVRVAWVAKGSLHTAAAEVPNPLSYAPATPSVFVRFGGTYRSAPNKKTTWHLLPVLRSGPPAPGHLMMSIPLYIGILLFGAYPLWLALPFRRRRKRKKLGLCLQCGYDLRGSKDKCSECGTEFEGSGV